jgi:hypothetical protein
MIPQIDGARSARCCHIKHPQYRSKIDAGCHAATTTTFLLGRCVQRSSDRASDRNYRMKVAGASRTKLIWPAAGLP